MVPTEEDRTRRAIDLAVESARVQEQLKQHDRRLDSIDKAIKQNGEQLKITNQILATLMRDRWWIGGLLTITSGLIVATKI